jgi:hypothetical protein
VLQLVVEYYNKRWDGWYKLQNWIEKMWSNILNKKPKKMKKIVRKKNEKNYYKNKK